MHVESILDDFPFHRINYGASQLVILEDVKNVPFLTEKPFIVFEMVRFPKIIRENETDWT